MQFRVFIQSQDGTEKWEVPYKTFSFSEELNIDRNAKFTFDDEALEGVAEKFAISAEYIISAAYREIYVVDEDDNTIYSGFLDEPSVSGSADGSSQTTVTSRGFFSLLGKRHLSAITTYSAQDMSDIAWDLISDTQALTYGDFGITRGADPATVSRDRTYQIGTFVKDAIERLSNNNILGGFDFDVNHQKQFNVFYPTKGSALPNLKLELGFNINTFNVRKTGILGMANQVSVFGQDQGGSFPIEVRDADNSYKDAYFLLQETLSESDVSVTQTLQDKGDEFLENNKTPRKELEITTDYDMVPFQSYDVGDTIPVKIAKGSVSIDDSFRLRKRSVNHDGTVTLTLFPR